MNVREFYSVVGGDYDDAIGRLMTEQRMCKYLRKLPATDDADNMNAAFNEGRWEEAFRISHNIKGVSLNLGLTALGNAAAVLCDTVRHGPPTEDFEPLLAEVNRQYALMLGALDSLEG